MRFQDRFSELLLLGSAVMSGKHGDGAKWAIIVLHEGLVFHGCLGSPGLRLLLGRLAKFLCGDYQRPIVYENPHYLLHLAILQTGAEWP